jgi:hypothetical protein
MNRRFFLAGAMAAGTTALLPRPAYAQVTVWDPANYGEAIKQLVQQQIISQSTADSASRALSLYNEYLRQGKVNINTIWASIIQPRMNDLLQVANYSLSIPLDAKNLIGTFESRYTHYSPDQPYGTVYQLSHDDAQRAIASTVLLAQKTFPELQNESLTLAKMIQQPVKSQADMLHLTNMLGYQLAQGQASMHGTMIAQMTNMSAYYNAMLAQQEAIRRSPGAVQLQTILRDVPRQLRASQ